MTPPLFLNLPISPSPAAFYIMVYGMVDVKKLEDGKEKTVATLAGGDYFGEIAIVSKSNSMASIVAQGKIVVLKMNKIDFLEFFAESPDDLIDFELKVLGAKSDLLHILRHPLGFKSFKSHMEKELAVENVEFWETIQEFRSLWNKDPDGRTDRAKEIISRWVLL